MRRAGWRWVALALVASLSGCTSDRARPLWIDHFDDLSAWTAHPASDVQMQLGSDDETAPVVGGTSTSSMRIDFAFPGSGWAIARREVDLTLPENYVFSFWIRGESGPQTVEFKLIDSSGENVWWSVHRDVEFDGQWQLHSIKKRQISFAWGPGGEDELRYVAAIEIAITASSGGKGTVWIDELGVRQLPPPSAVPPRPLARASSSAGGTKPQAVVDGDPSTAWSPAGGDAAAQLTLDLRELREFGGLVLEWAPGRGAADYDLDLSDDGVAWRPLAAIRGANGGRDFVHAPDHEARWVRLRVRRAAADTIALAEIEVRPVDWAPRREDLFAEIAKEHPRGAYPRAYLGEQSYWTVVGGDHENAESLMSEDGAIELGPWQPSLEPVVTLDGRAYTWADVHRSSSLEDGHLPLPSVQWIADAFSLDIMAAPIGVDEDAALAMRYRIENTSASSIAPTLHLAVRPFQVNPPTQFLNRPGGVAPIHRLRADAQGFEIEGRRAVVWVDAPAEFGVAAFASGDVVAEYLLRGERPRATQVEDPFGAASGVASYPLPLEPGAAAEILVLVPFGDDATGDASAETMRETTHARIEQSRAQWQSELGRVTIDLPPSAQWIEDTLHAQIAYVLVNRDGAAIQPGSRSYARSWIRDGALTSSALLRTGHADAARAFLEWFAPHQFADGKIPCVVDHRGGDPVDEHDSSGEFVFLVAELLRMTQDRALAERMWPRVEAAVAYLDSLRQLRRTDAYTRDETRVFFGLLPESISHEGYSAKPMHSYWDDFWALRGFRDAAWLAGQLDRPGAQARWSAVRDEFGAELAASVRRALEVHDIDYVPGCADLGDFDATSTTIALAPTGAAAWLPPEAVEATFERYWDFFRERRDGAPWDAYTPYELRNVGAFVHLGWRDRAHEALTWFREHQRPAGWNHWAEVVVEPERSPRFLGDMPHTWVGSDFVRAVLDMVAYVNGVDDDELVLGAGLTRAWIEEADGVRVAGLPTPFGALDFSVRSRGPQWEARVAGDLRLPAGGVWLRLPFEGSTGVRIDGLDVALPDERGLRIDRLPTTILVNR